MEDVWTQVKTFVNDLSFLESDYISSNTASLELSDEIQDLSGFPDLSTPSDFSMDPDESDILMTFGDPINDPVIDEIDDIDDVIPTSLVQVVGGTPGGPTITPCSTRDYIHGAKTYASKSFNMILGIAMVAVYQQDVKTRVPGSLLGEFCGDVGLESMILNLVGNLDGFVTKRVVVTGGPGVDIIEVSIKRSVLTKLCKHEGNDTGSSRLSEILLGGVSEKTRSGANIRKIWGSLKRDIVSRRGGKGKKNAEFLDKIGYRRISARNCEFFVRLPVVVSEQLSYGEIRV